MGNVHRIVPLPLLILLAAGCCGYSVRALLPPHLGSVAVPPVENTTTRPGLGDELTDTLTDAFKQDRSLRIAVLENADLVVTANISLYSRVASTYTGEQEITTYDISVSAAVEAEDQVRSETFYKGTAAARVTYDPDSETEEEAATRALSELADEIVRLVITAW